MTIEVFDPYVSALGVRLELSVMWAGCRTRLLGDAVSGAAWALRADSAKSASFNALNHCSRKRADSAESAEKPTGKTPLNGTRTQTNRCPHLAKVMVAGSNFVSVVDGGVANPVQQNLYGTCRRRPRGALCRVD